MKVDVFAKNKLLFESNNAISVNLVTEKGETTILKDHVKMIAKIEPCSLKIVFDNTQEKNIDVMGGFLHLKDNIVTILAHIEHKELETLEVSLHQTAIQNAFDLINEAQSKTNVDYAFIIGELQRELLKMKKNI